MYLYTHKIKMTRIIPSRLHSLVGRAFNCAEIGIEVNVLNAVYGYIRRSAIKKKINTQRMVRELK